MMTDSNPQFFKVLVPEIHIKAYHVSAIDAEDANRKIIEYGNNCNSNSIVHVHSLTYSHRLDNSEWIVERIERENILKDTIYAGIRRGNDKIVTAAENGSVRKLPTAQNVYNHSPDGFDWGYAGSGPSQLALALCIDVLGDKNRALKVYQKIKLKFIVGLNSRSWTIPATDIYNSIIEIEKRND